MERSKINELFQKKPTNTKVMLCGWVRTKRDSKGGFSFIELNDGSCLKNIQIVIDASLENYQTDITKLSAGCSLIVEGTIVKSPGSGQSVEVQATKVSVLGWSDSEKYPMQKKRHSFEYLRQIAHLRPRTNTFGAITRVRNKLSFATHKFFQNQGFQYIHTPIITGSDCEGAGEMFRVTTLNMEHTPTVDGKIDYSKDFFGRQTNLTVSGQLEAETYALALGDVYTFGPTFRAENSNTSRHLSEFWMVEPEMAFCDLTKDIIVAEEFLKYIIKTVLEESPQDMEFFDKFIDKNIIDTLTKIVESEFAKITYSEAINILEKANVSFQYPVKWGENLQAEHEQYLAEQYFKKPVAVTDYPKQIKSFYMRMNDDEKTVAAMDILFPKIGEIIGGSQREERFDLLEKRIQDSGLNIDEYWWYLDLRRYGSVPHAGFGLGFDRMIQFISGMGNIRDVIPFPRTPKNAEF